MLEKNPTQSRNILEDADILSSNVKTPEESVLRTLETAVVVFEELWDSLANS